ncbi:MAG: carboxypeptidase-like regulatory domain-containing protein [Cyclobacteriaceae bacterium]
MKQYLACWLLLLICYALPQIGFGQSDQQVILRGVIVDADSLSPLPYVHIREKNDRMGSATALNGQFSVSVNVEDTILFTSVGYKPYQLVPADSAEENLIGLVIPMVPNVQELKEVTVKAYDDITKYIRREEVPFSMNKTKGTPLFEKKEAEEQKAVRMAPGMNGARLEGAVTAFANLFNDKFQQEKKLKELLEIKEAEEQQKYLEQIMTERYQELVAQASKMNEADILRFTKFYMPHPLAMIDMDDYTIMVSILENLERFQPELKRRLAIEELLEKKVFEGEEQTKSKQ